MAVNWKQTANVYVAPWGDDVVNDGTETKPYRSIQDTDQEQLIASGTYYSQAFTQRMQLVGDGFVIVDGNYVSVFSGVTSNGGTTRFENLQIKNYEVFQSNISSGIYALYRVKNCHLKNIGTFTARDELPVAFIQSLIENLDDVDIYVSTHNSGLNDRSTFIDSGVVLIFDGNYLFQNCLISGGTLHIKNKPIIQNCLIDTSTQIRMTGGGLGNDESSFTVPSGATPGDKLNNLRNRAATVYGGSASNYFLNCKVDDPLFNDPTNRDYTLQPNSPAKNLAFNGGPVGKYGIAIKWNFKASAVTSDFLNLEATNLTIADDSLTLTDVDLVGELEGKPKDCGEQCELAGLPVIGDIAFRNGEALGKNRDLAASTIAAGTGVITIGDFYVVEDDPISHDGNSFNIGDTFKATTADFTTTGSGVVRKVEVTPFRPNVEWRFSVGNGDSLTNVDSLVVDSWYVVKSGTATYNGDSYTPGNIFKCSSGGGTSFSGNGVLETIFTASDDYHQYEVDAKPMTNRVGNEGSAAITKGNGASDFDFDNQFPVITRYAQPKITIQVDNLS